MDAGNGEGGQSLQDIQTYLASFNKEISGTGQQIQNQDFILQQAGDFNNLIEGQEGGATLTVVQGEDGTAQLVVTSQSQVMKQEGVKQDEFIEGETPTLEAAADMEEAPPPPDHVDQPLLTPAAPVATEEGEVTPTQQPILNIQPSSQPTDNAVQVLASVAATSIPQVTSTVTSLGGQQQSQTPESQPVAVQSTPPSLATPASANLAQAQQAAAVQAQQQSVVLNTGSSYQTVTIVPSEVSQGGEVSYVLIVSQPDADGKDLDRAGISDMSVYDFKEDRGGGMEEEEEEEYDTGRKIIRATRKSYPGMQAQLMCNYCNYTSPKRYLLTRHMKTHSEERPHKCNICDRGFKTVASLQNHINTHTGVRPHKCKECDAAFTTSGELVRHVRYRHTFEKPHRCTECDYSSVELSKLKRHMRSHTGERPYQCPHCSYASPDTYKLKRHLRIHTGEKPYECEVCNARFTQSNSLKAHKLIHTGNKPVFQCELCPTTCGRKTDLKIHVQKLHTSDKPLQCKKCGKSFPDRYTYKIHLKTHEGEKCFKCELCPYSALSQRHLESHILTHTGEKPYQCEECDQVGTPISFRQKQLLKRHKNLYHTPDYVPPAPRDKTHECQECGKTFAHRGNLLRHMAMHDPENPDYQDIEETEEEEEDEHEVGQTIIQTPVQMVQVMTEDGQLQEVPAQIQQVIDTPRGRPRRGQQQVQLVMTDDGENATQIFLQVEEGDVGAVGTVMQQEEEEELQQEEEEQVEEEPPQEVETPPVKRGRGRPPKTPKREEEEEEVVQEEVVEEESPKKRGRGRPPKSAMSPRRGRLVKAEEDEEEEEEEAQEEEEEGRATRGLRKRSSEQSPQAKRRSVGEETPSKRRRKADSEGMIGEAESGSQGHRMETVCRDIIVEIKARQPNQTQLIQQIAQQVVEQGAADVSQARRRLMYTDVDVRDQEARSLAPPAASQLGQYTATRQTIDPLPQRRPAPRSYVSEFAQYSRQPMVVAERSGYIQYQLNPTEGSHSSQKSYQGDSGASCNFAAMSGDGLQNQGYNVRPATNVSDPMSYFPDQPGLNQQQQIINLPQPSQPQPTYNPPQPSYYSPHVTYLPPNSAGVQEHPEYETIIYEISTEQEGVDEAPQQYSPDNKDVLVLVDHTQL